MANYEVPFDDTLNIFNSVILSKGLDNLINIRIYTDNKLKDIYKAHKSNDLHKFETKVDLHFSVNENVFSQLEDWQQLIVAEEAITGVVFNMDKDKLELKKGDMGFTANGAYSGIAIQYGYERYENVRESIKTLYDMEKEKASV